jgi:O-antigen/teichoic acid export membrane protein
MEPAASAGASARVYMPAVMVSRALALIRLLLVARILGEARKGQYGVYQQALVLMNWLVPVVMFGLGDVAERYAARFEREGRLAWWVRRHAVRLAATGLAAATLLIAATPWVGRNIFHLDPSAGRAWMLDATCAAAIIFLALYQYVAALLRGMRAYNAVAGMEVTSAILLLILSTLAAIHGSAVGLVYMYAVSVGVPMLFFAGLAWSRINAPTTAAGAPRSVRLSRFGRWALVRLLLMMSFGFLSVWGVGYLAAQAGWPSRDVQEAQAEYAIPYRMAELLSYIAITAWASTYGIAAKFWAHGQTRRARAELFRIGRFGAAALALMAALAVICRSPIGWLLPAYADVVRTLLPPMAGVFIWYGLLAFCSTYADLRETPHRGAWLWGAAVAGQAAVMLLTPGGAGTPADAIGPRERVVVASAVGVGLALLILAPLVLWRPLRLTATAIPPALVALSALVLFVPADLVGWIAPVVLIAVLLLLQSMGLLVRRSDRRRWRRWRNARAPAPLAPIA